MPSDEDNWNSLREKIIGLGERSIHKSYYPELQQQIAELKRFRTLLDQSNDAIFLLDLPSGLIADMNKSTLKQLGFTRPEMLEMVIGDIVISNKSNEMKKLLDDLQKTDLEDKKNIITTFIKKSGAEIPVEISISKVEFSNSLYVVMVARDIKERNEAQEALRQSEEKYRILFESSPDIIVLINLKGEIIDINDAAYKPLMLPRDELIGKPFTELKILNKDDLPKFTDLFFRLVEGASIAPIELKTVNEDGDERWIEAYPSLLKKKGKDNIIQIIAHDITKRKKAEKQIKQSLKEKEVLLREIHHRVKNNLQIISSLLNLQSDCIEESYDVFMESQNRIKSMALIHEKLYQSEDLTRIDFAEYIESLVFHLFRSYSVDTNFIKPLINVEDVLLDIDTSIPCGLIINELITNSLKYAFPANYVRGPANGTFASPTGQKGEISVDLHLDGEKAVLIISDNGIGLPEGIDFYSTKTLGLKLVNILVDQIDGEIEMYNDNGAAFKIKFIKVPYHQRI